METRLISRNFAEVDSECLVVVVLDHGDKQKSEPKLAFKDAALDKAIAELVASGEITGKANEAVMLHRPQGLRAKRLLAIGAGKAKNFGHVELRRAAGTAVRTLKSRMIKSCAIAVPELTAGPEEAVRAIVEGAYIADFDPDTYRSERKDQSMNDITIAAPPGLDPVHLQNSLDQARIVDQSQNFTRELVNEPSNRLTPTMLADRAKSMSQAVGLRCEVMEIGRAHV